MKIFLLSSALLIFSPGIFSLLEGGAGGCKAQTQSKSPWLTTGNISTTQSAGSDFIGFSNTTVQAPLIFKTMGQDRLHIAPDGKIGIGITPTEAFELGFGNARFPNNVDVIGIIHVGPPVGIGPPLPIVPGGPPVVEVHGNTSILGNLASNGVLAATDVQTNTLTVKTTGSINNLTVNNLAGSGDRFTVVDANGNLKTGGPVPQTICTVAPWCTAGNTGTSPPTDFLGTTDAQDLVFKTDGNEQMRITSSGHIPTTNHPGNVGIGTDDPQKKLHVATTHTFCTSCPQSHQGIRLENHLLNPTSGKDYVSTWDLEPVLGGALSNSVPTQSVFMIGTPGSPVMTLTEQGGNVGIGTSSPQAKLDVNGDVNVTAGHQYFINGKPFTSSQWLQGINQNDIYYSSGNIGIGTNNPYANLHVNGTVIIGNTKGITGTHSDFLLAVDGKIVSKSTFVTVSNWQDKVFSNDYIPMSLDKVEEYYTKNKHLPDYPAEKEIIDNGLDLGSTATLQQKSIEEIMLYLVDMKKQMNTLKEQNKKLENEIEKMKQEK